MSKTIVADTGPLIALALVELLSVLPQLFATVYVPDGVLSEATQDLQKPGAKEIKFALQQGWIVSHSVVISADYLDLIDLLDCGEAETLALAKQLQAIALIDEQRGRNVAIKHNITITGTAAVLLKAKQLGAVPLVKPLLDTLTQNGYRLSSALINNILSIAGE